MKNAMSISHRFSAFLLLLGILVLTSCKGQPKDNTDLTREFKMNCVIMNKSQFQAWVDSGWTKPSDPGKIRTVLFQFYSPEGAEASQNMTLLAYPGNTWSNVIVNGRTDLTIDTACVPLKLAGKTVLANNVVNIKTLNILNEDGTLTDFDFIRFRPVKVHGEYVSFAFEVIKMVDNRETYLEKDDTNPCPPYCPPAPGDTLRNGL